MSEPTPTPAVDPDVQEAIRRGLIRPRQPHPAESDPDVREAVRRGLVQVSGPKFELTPRTQLAIQGAADEPWPSGPGEFKDPARQVVDPESSDPRRARRLARAWKALTTPGEIQMPGHKTTESDVAAFRALPPEERTRRQREQADQTRFQEDTEEELLGSSGPFARVVHGVLGPSEDLARRKKVGPDAVIAAALNTAGGAVSAPFTAATSVLPENVQTGVEAPFEAIDKYAAEPLGRLTGSEAVRAGVNIGAPLVAGAGVARFVKGYRVGRAAEVARLTRAAEERAAASRPVEPYGQELPRNIRPKEGKLPVRFETKKDMAVRAKAEAAEQSYGQELPQNIRPERGKLPVRFGVEEKTAPVEASPENPLVREAAERRASIEGKPEDANTRQNAAVAAGMERVARGESAEKVAADIEKSLPEMTDAGVSEGVWARSQFEAGVKEVQSRTGPVAAESATPAPTAPRPTFKEWVQKKLGTVWVDIDWTKVDDKALEQEYRTTIKQPATRAPQELEEHRLQQMLTGHPEDPLGNRIVADEPGAIAEAFNESRARERTLQTEYEKRLAKAVSDYKEMRSPRTEADLFKNVSRIMVQRGDQIPTIEEMRRVVGEKPVQGRGMRRGRGQSGEFNLDILDPGKWGEAFGRKRGGQIDLMKSGEEGPRGWTPAFADRAIEYLRRYGPAGERLSDALENTLSRQRTIVGEAGAPFNEAADALSLTQRAAAQKNLKGWAEGTIPIPGWAQPLVRGWEATWNMMADVLNKSGSKIVEEGGMREITPGARKFPTRPRSEVIEGLIKENGVGPLTDEWKQANPGVENPFEQAVGESKSDFVRRARSHLEGSYAGVERPHTYNWPESMQTPNYLDTARYYLKRAAGRAAEHEQFKYNYETKGGDFVRTEGELRRLLDEINDPYAESLALRILGRNPQDLSMSPFMRGLNRAEGMYTTTSKLGLSVGNYILHGTHMLIGAMETGPTIYAKGLFKALAKYGESKRGAVRKGVLDPQATEMSNMGVLDEPRTGGRLSQTAGIATKTVTAPNNIIVQIARMAASEAAPEYLQSLQRQLARGGRAAEAATRALERLHMASDLPQIAAGEVDLNLSNKFAQRLADYTNLASSTADKPTLNRILGLDPTDPRQQVLFRFKGVHTAATRVFLDSALLEARHGNFKPMATAVAGAVALYELKKLVQTEMGGPRDDMEDLATAVKSGDVSSVAAQVAKAVGVEGMSGFLVPAGESVVPSGEKGETSLSRELGNVLLPPIASTVKNIGQEYDQAFKTKTYEQGGRAQAGKRPPPETRWGAAGRSFMDLLGEEWPQARKALEAYRYHTDDQFRREKLRESLKVGPGGMMVPREGQEKRINWLRELSR